MFTSSSRMNILSQLSIMSREILFENSIMAFGY
jgi:hypothetical protein